ncbi:C1-like [Macleaya cordata]|uniref:C1-like n=1 Tax=Macleaya cordata TaxID=56857 RepID=A0A200RAE1_MACCD|nr:C1-like [Macleaya cordata]
MVGKLNYNPYIKHFSHEHPLELSNIQIKTLKPSSCSGCKLEPFGWIYTCKTCNYILHISCSQMPQLINHPSHPNHPLSLLPSPPYPEGFFNCDACNRQGHGFCYHCTACNFDIHISCASLPLALNHRAHHHPLNLTFHLPYQTKGFSCDICRNLGSNSWIYRCNLCEFDAHLDCARTTANQNAFVQQSHQTFQHHHSFPGANHPPPRVNNTTQLPNYYVNTSPNVGVMQSNVRPVQINPPPVNYALNNNTVMGMAIQGFVDGVAQQAGQNFVQSLLGSSSAAGGNNNGGSSSFTTDFGGSIFNGDSSTSGLGMFEDSTNSLGSIG